MDDTDRDASLETIPDRVGEEHNQSVLLTAEELQRMNNLADEQVNVIKAALGIHGSIAVKKDEDNLDAVLVLYAVTHGQTKFSLWHQNYQSTGSGRAAVYLLVHDSDYRRIQ